MSKVYDCCMFFQELDMLELRFNILNDVVDHFVVCEATETHSGQPKPLNLLTNWDRFKPWHNKLIYVNAGPLSDGSRNSWERERYHRSRISEGVSWARRDDWIIVADCDEIPNPDVVARIKDSDLQAAKLEMTMYYYDFNHVVRQGWAVGMYRNWIESDPNKIRTCSGYNPTQFQNAGWHFSYFGGPEAILEKRDAFMHHGDPIIRDLPHNRDYIKSRIAASQDLYGRDLPIEHVPTSDSLPRYVLDRADKFQAMGWLE